MQYQKIVKASALYDFVFTLPFVTPWTFQVVYNILNLIAPIPSFAPSHILFVNLFGSIVIVWSVLRIRHPLPQYGFYDSIGRLLFSIWFIYNIVFYKTHPMIMLFALLEVSWFIIQAYGYWRISQSYRIMSINHR
ncbi:MULTISPECIES: hypothetical protein [unclassified Acinetobacter]|uniref:hypothetical protein n=1 Tax=unclassified Acinetobacter TaxID=196816 RepID=UPI00293434E6|nr:MULTISPECIES: hypothetical protein [unclassified Acinetobacter]WOE32675.1 hypothetical protein QSG84_05670 [Acinetobacter sp. SAAs470]WOE38151.1 hypothetical protein QSG86_14725 [Acinetobacter sp. SAAs474]